MQISKAKTWFIHKNKNKKRGWAGKQEILNKTKLWLWKIRQNLTWPNPKNVKLVAWSEVRILQRTEENLETKYCAEVIVDGVQLWNKRQVTWVNLMMWKGKKHSKTWKQDMTKNQTQNMTWQKSDWIKSQWEKMCFKRGLKNLDRSPVHHRAL